MIANNLLYKYLPPERIDVLCDGRIRFTPPAALNDPFECSPRLDVSITSDALKHNLRAELEAKVTTLLSQSGLDADERAEAHRLAADAESMVTRLANPDALSDELLDRLRTMVSRNIGVLSLSRTPTNSVMWASYAANHTGLVLGFDPDTDWFRVRDAEGEPTRPLVVEYVDEPPMIPIACVYTGNDSSFRQALLATKPAAWAYEEEVRLTRLFAMDHDVVGKDINGWPIRLFDVDKDAIRSVVLGCRATEPLAQRVERLLTLAGLDHVAVFHARLNIRKHIMEIVPRVRVSE